MTYRYFYKERIDLKVFKKKDHPFKMTFFEYK